MNRPLKVLINAYACCPHMGSEQGVGWNWCVNLVRYCELFIITEEEYRPQIEQVIDAVVKTGEEQCGLTPDAARRLHFYYNPVSDRVRRMCWNQGDWRFYWHYRRWQLKTADMARDIVRKEQIDILHQLNMIGFREPGYLWKVAQETGIKFIWGPVDAKDRFPMAYAINAPLKIRVFLKIKNAITIWQLKYGRRVRKAARTASYVISSTSNSLRSFKEYIGINSVLINETGTYPIEDTSEFPECEAEGRPFNILWVGKMDFRKQLKLALYSFAKAKYDGMKLHIVGGDISDECAQLIEKLKIGNYCIFHGRKSHKEVQTLMQQSDILLFTSVAEGTPHVVLEAISNGLPILCFDTCGQGDCVDSMVGKKIPLTTFNRSASDFAEALDSLFCNRSLLAKMSQNCIQYSFRLSWMNKAKEMVELYNHA